MHADDRRYFMNEKLKTKFSISTDKSKLNLSTIHNFLKTSYWAGNVPLSVIEKSIKHSLCFGVYEDEEQVGFARVITDYATFAYLTDIFILEAYREQGLGKWLVKYILEHPELQGFRRWLLRTKDAHKLYAHYGFQSLVKPDFYMEIINSNVYQQ